MDAIEQHNADKTQTYTLGRNQFTHLTLEEFKEAAHIGGIIPPNLRSHGGKVQENISDASALPTTVDWVAAGAVTPVKNQGSCGSCWSFSTTGALEGAYFIKYRSLLSFSEQNLVSCDKSDSACDGGWMDTAFGWVKSNGGLATEDSYPYVSGDNTVPACDTTKAKVAGAAPVSFTDVTANNVNALATAVAQQPVSIAIQANQAAFQSYSGGIISGRCGTNIDHGVLAVGYGHDSATGLDYWKVKNSWGPTWGSGGYVYIEKSSADLCGVLVAPSYPNM